MQYTEKDYERFQTANEISKRAVRNETISKEENKFAASVYKQLGNKAWRSCSNCWQDLFILTNIINLKKSQTMSERKFTLKEGKMLQIHGFDPISDKNLTDEIAVKVLKKSKGYIKFFGSYPSNWQELVDEKVEKKVKTKKETTETKSETKAEMKSKLEEYTKAELKNMLKSYEYPENEYEKLSKDKLIEYFLNKQF